MLIACVSNLVDFLYTFRAVEACTKLTDEERDTKTLSVFFSGCKSLVVPVLASIFVRGVRLSCCAHSRIELAAVGMIIEDMNWGPIISTWRIGETKIPHSAT